MYAHTGISKKVVALTFVCAAMFFIGCKTRKASNEIRLSHAVTRPLRYEPLSKNSGTLTIPSHKFHSSIRNVFSNLPKNVHYTLTFTKKDGTRIDICARCNEVNTNENTVTLNLARKEANILCREWSQISFCKRACRRASKTQICIIGPS